MPGATAPTAGPGLLLRVAEELRFLLPRTARTTGVLRSEEVGAGAGHVVQAAGVPLTEVGTLLLDGRPVGAAERVGPGAVLAVAPVRRPQPVPAGGFLLDVHHGALARRLRLLGLDAAYRNDADDPGLVARAAAEDRVLLTQDRGLLMRRALPRGALVRGRTTAEQLADVLERFAPATAPLTRCPACNGPLHDVAKADVADRLPPGTRRGYEQFREFGACRRLYW
ncbi:Mut7-C RNAse domain-containing protein, partial [Kineococcus glutinatus]|uniref:Mut7-C RNAse domain-containing protein n=1 Tax=Kineococcus glutinatus TaxID=1070872 RepID=UPI0031F100D5